MSRIQNCHRVSNLTKFSRENMGNILLRILGNHRNTVMTSWDTLEESWLCRICPRYFRLNTQSTAKWLIFEGRGKIIKLFDPSYGFEVKDFEIAIFGKISPGYLQNRVSDQKVLRYDPPPKKKLWFLRPNKVFGVQSCFLGPPKTQKIDFLKKPELCDLTKHGFSHNGSGHPGTIGPLDTIQKLTLYLTLIKLLMMLYHSKPIIHSPIFFKLVEFISFAEQISCVEFILFVDRTSQIGLLYRLAANDHLDWTLILNQIHPFNRKRVRATLESSSKRGSFDRISNHQE